MNLEHLKVGVNVDIQRTDGRIHSAAVTGIAGDTQSVTVEWFERGETKGKEIDIEDIVSLNPELGVDNETAPRNHPVIEVPKANEVSKNSRLPSARSNRPSVAKNAVNQNGISAPPPAEPSKKKAAAVAAAPPPAAADAGAAAAARRKSNCVKEVERIKERREQRRAQQMALREYNEENYDTSHPQWEFLAKILDFRENIDFQPLTNTDEVKKHQISVCLRQRPMNKKELSKKDISVITVPNKDNVIIHEPKSKVDLTKYLENQTFRFDYAFDDSASNELVYKYTAKPLVESIFEGGMATCFAYGQTGSGKTHTMGGDFTSKGQQDCARGIYALASHDVFKLLNSKFKKLDLVVGASFFEIYSGKVFDLLNRKQKLQVLEDGKQQVCVVGLKEEAVTRVDDVLKLLQHGARVRTSGTTSANNHSSRSHAVFQLIVRRKGSKKVFGKFSLIDLAGNERGADTSSSDRQTRMEGAEINKSLLALKECIRALGRKGEYLPFRASKLTQVLRDSFIGDKSRTCMIATISPGMSCCEHTLNTLRYADRVKELGPGEGPAGKVSNGDQRSKIPSGPLSPQNSDLVRLRTTNEEEVSEEMLTFHEIINHVQELEEEVLDEHRQLVEEMQKALDGHKKLLKMTEEVDYDTEAYARQLDGLLGKKSDRTPKLKEKLSSFRAEMQEEETMSRNIKPGRRPPNK